MEQEPGQDPGHDDPEGPRPPPGSSPPGAGPPGPDATSGAPGAGADAYAGDGGGGAEGESVFGPWDGLEGTLGAAREREELLAGFAPGGVWDQHAPGPELAAAVARAAGTLGVIRALIRDDDPAFLGRSRHGDLPDEWDDSLVHEIALALAVSAPSAGRATRAAGGVGAP